MKSTSLHNIARGDGAGCNQYFWLMLSHLFGPTCTLMLANEVVLGWSFSPVSDISLDHSKHDLSSVGCILHYGQMGGGLGSRNPPS